jgi:phospholipase C
MRRRRTGFGVAAVLGAIALLAVGTAADAAQGGDAAASRTATPIQHLVVIFQENVSFDHYFGTYPSAVNRSGEPRFEARPGTPAVNGLSPALLTTNPNQGNPQRIDRTQPLTCDQDHNYPDEQKAFDAGVMDKFVEFTGAGAGPTLGECLIPKQPANPSHAAPSSKAAIGHTDQANHEYDLSDFWQAADSGNLPGVSYLKAPNYQDGHAGYSDPLDEQAFLVDTINHLQRPPTWERTAVVIAYDDSDGWYDHQMGPILNQSQTPLDALSGAGQCGANPARVPSGQEARCGLGPRLPLLVVSPWTRPNSVDHSLTDQSSVVRFIEDNWGLGRVGGGSFDARTGTIASLFDFGHPQGGRLLLDPTTGEPSGHS